MMQMLMTLPPEARADIMASWRAGEEGGVNNMELVSPEQLQMAAEMVAGTDPEGGMSKEDRAAANAMLEEIKKGSEKTRADKKDGRGEVEKRIEAARQGMKEKR